MPPQNLNPAQALPPMPLQLPTSPNVAIDSYRPPPDAPMGSVAAPPLETYQTAPVSPASPAAASFGAQSYAQPAQYASSVAVASSVSLDRPAMNTIGLNPPKIAVDESGPNSLAIKGIVLGVIFAPLGLFVSLIAHKRHRTAQALLLSRIGLAVSTAGMAMIVVAIVALLSSFATVRAHNVDLVYQNRIGAVEPEIQATFIKNGSYPTLAQLNSDSWRGTNMVGTTLVALSPVATKPTPLVGDKATKSSFAYAAFPAHCSGTKVSPCTTFTLAAQQSTGGDYSVN